MSPADLSETLLTILRTPPASLMVIGTSLFASFSVAASLISFEASAGFGDTAFVIA